MPKKTFFRKKKYFRKKRTPLATKKYVKQQLRKDIETKYYDRVTGNTTVDYAGTAFFQLSNVPQGSDDSSRVGDKLTIRGLTVRLALYHDTAANDDDHVRVVIFQFHPNTAMVAAAVNQFYPAAYLSQLYTPLSPYRHDLQDQFTVLYDRSFSLTSSSSDNKMLVIKPKLKWAKKSIEFDAASTNASNHLYLLVTNGYVAGSSATSVGYVSRLYYDDA